jgi:hypothetical protein
MVARINPAARSDLYSPWAGTRAALHGTDPYSVGVTEQIQKDIYGHVLQPTETWDRQAFVYPAYILFLLGPFTWLPWRVVDVIFAVLAPIALAGTVGAWMRVCAWNSDRFKTLIVLALILASWPAAWGYYQRQPSLFVAAAIAFSVLLFQRESDVAAGILLALATVKPQLVVLIAAWLLVLAVAHRRWRFVSAFGLTVAVLVAGSLAIVPGWIPHWIHASLAYSHYPAKISMLVFFFGRAAGTAAAIALAIVLCVKLWKVGAVPPRAIEFGHATALVLAVTVCIMPENPWLVFNTLLLIPAIFVLFGQRSKTALAGVLRSIAGLAIGIAFLATPLCAAAGMRMGVSLTLVMPPFLLGYLVPIPVTAALLFLKSGDRRLDPHSAPVTAAETIG